MMLVIDREVADCFHIQGRAMMPMETEMEMRCGERVDFRHVVFVPRSPANENEVCDDCKDKE